MGHTRLGTIPKSRKWKDIVALLSAQNQTDRASVENEIELIALKSLDAASNGFDKAINDVGLRFVFFLLTQLALSSRENDWTVRLSKCNVDVSNTSSVVELLSELQLAVDDYIVDKARPTDVSEIAQKALGEAVGALIEPRTHTLFGTGREELQAAIRGFSTKDGFGHLGQKFFANFMAHYLNFYLSRVTAAQVGSRAFGNVQDVSRFNDVLRAHCEQSARIVHTFCGEWYSKTEYLEGINIENTSRFMAIALKKLKSEVRKQRGTQ